MKTRLLGYAAIMAVCLLLVLFLFVNATITQSPQPSDKDHKFGIQELNKKVSQLEAEVAGLQQQVNELKEKAAHPYIAFPMTHSGLQARYGW